MKTNPFEMIQPCPQIAPSAINALPIIVYRIVFLFGIMIENSLLIKDVKKEPSIIPKTNILPQPRPWPSTPHPIPAVSIGQILSAQVKIGVEIPKLPTRPVRLLK